MAILSLVEVKSFSAMYAPPSPLGAKPASSNSMITVGSVLGFWGSRSNRVAHIAIGVVAARACRGDPSVPMITLGTAHAAKFPDAVGDACGVRPALPARLADIYEREERVTVVPNDLASVEALVRQNRMVERQA